MIHSPVDLFFVTFFAALNGVYGLFVFLAMLDIWKRRAARLPELDPLVLAGAATPPITVIAPAFDEEATIVDSVRSFLQLEYPHLQVVVVNDGSRDGTLDRLRKAFQLEPLELVVRQILPTLPVRMVYQSARHPRLWVVDKANGGKADALNVGLNVARTPLVCCLDADTVVHRRALLRMVEPFLYDEEHVVAVGGTVRVANGCRVRSGLVEEVGLPRSWLARFQVVEYLRSFLFGRVGLNRFGGNLIISGAFGLFLREAVMEVGGYRDDTVGEDMELVVRLHRRLREQRRPYRVVHLPDPNCYTEVPEDLGVLARQRDRWQRGLADSLVRHRTLMANPRFGAVGFLVFPVFVCFELLGPVLELGGYGWFAWRAVRGELCPELAVLFFAVAFFLGFLLSVQSLLLDRMESGFYRGFKQHLVLLGVAALENFGYRQLTLLFRLRGAWRYLRGEKSWGAMVRRGFEDSLQEDPS